MESESADAVMFLFVAFLAPLHVSSWELSGDTANYPVYTTNVITPLWEVTHWMCSRYWMWGSGGSVLYTCVCCHKIIITGEYSTEFNNELNISLNSINEKRSIWKLCHHRKSVLLGAFNFMWLQMKQCSLKLINLFPTGLWLITDEPHVWSGVI